MRTSADGGLESGIEIQGAWYALYTKHQHEKTATAHLRGRGFEVFLPLYKAVHRWKDRNQTVQLPLFPCYVFLRATLTDRSDVLRAPGVLSFVGNGGRACPVPESEIEAVRMVAHSRSHFEPHPFLKTGDRVRVLSGPLTGIEGFLQRIKSRSRIILSVELLQKSVAVELDVAAVEPVSLATQDLNGLSQRTYGRS